VTETPAATLARLIDGYQVSQAIHVAAVLGIADRLAGGARGVDELAVAAGADVDALYRLLRALAAVGVLEEGPDRSFALTEVGAGLRTDVPESSAAWASFIGRPYYWGAWSQLLHSVQTGENAFRALHGVDPWGYRERDPEEGAIFDRTMAAGSRRSIAALVEAYDFAGFETVVDVGGGRGGLLEALLERHEWMHGVLFDQPHVVAGAPQGDRLEVAAGSFFESVPGGGDAYVLKWILHDWDDPEAAAILRTVRAAMRDDAVLLLIERELAPPNEGAEAKLSDLNMLVAPGGRERTRAEYAALLAATGFELVRAVATRGPLSVLEARPARSTGPPAC
jgi:hypothetical protein